MMSLNHRYSLLFISGHADCYPPLFQWIFQFTSSVHSYSMRQSCNRNLYVISVNTTEYGLRSLKFTGPRLWNSLPTSMTNSNSLRIFCKTHKNSILAHEEILFIKKICMYIMYSVCNCILMQGSSTKLAFAIWMTLTCSPFCCYIFLVFLNNVLCLDAYRM